MPQSPSIFPAFSSNSSRVSVLQKGPWPFGDGLCTAWEMRIRVIQCVDPQVPQHHLLKRLSLLQRVFWHPCQNSHLQLCGSLWVLCSSALIYMLVLWWDHAGFVTVTVSFLVVSKYIHYALWALLCFILRFEFYNKYPNRDLAFRDNVSSLACTLETLREVETAEVLGTWQRCQVCTGLEFLWHLMTSLRMLLCISTLRSTWLQNNKPLKRFLTKQWD